MANRIQSRVDTAANWTTANSLLLEGEWAYESDTGNLKLGDGATPWNTLPYYTGGVATVVSVAGKTGVVLLVKADVGLGNVDNTDDVSKPVSTAQAAADTAVAAFSIARANHTGTQLSSTISNFSSSVLGTVLTGLSLASSAAITATDTILAALGQLQAQVTLKLADPMTTIGDLIFRNGGNVSSRLPVGSSNQILKVSGGLPSWVDENFAVLFGSGSLGSATISGSTTLLANAFYDVLTLDPGGVINLGGYSLYAKKIVLTSADARAIRRDGNNGVNAALASGGAAGAALAAAVHGASGAGTAGGSGTIAVGGQAAAPGTVSSANGGGGGQGSAGGASGIPNAGGALRAGGAINNPTVFEYLSNTFLRGIVLVGGGSGGAGGGAGGGDGVVTGAGGGGGGGGGGVSAIYCLELETGGSTPAGVFSARGGNGGNGFQRVTGTNMGGAGGAGGGGGGYIYFAYLKKTGAVVTNLFDAGGGNGGNASNGTGTGTGGNGGEGGDGGAIQIVNVSTGALAVVKGSAGNAGTVASGVTGGVGGSGGTCQASL